MRSMRTRAFGCVVLMALAACAPAAPSTAGPQGDGYLYRAGSELLFVRWDGTMGAPGGRVDWYHTREQRVTADFTAAPDEGGFSFRFPAGSFAGWTGTFAGDGITLVVPSDGGGLRTIALPPASTEAFDAALATLE